MRRLFSRVLCCFLLLLCCSFSSPTPEAWALASPYARAMEREARWVIAQHPRYLYGGNKLDKGIDCSYFVYLVCKRAGIIGLQRLSADDIYHAQDGWKNITINIKDAEQLDMLFWIWQKKGGKPYELTESLKLLKTKAKRIDHMGLVLTGKSGLLEVGHMSSSKGGIITPFRGTLERDCVGVRRLTIGDKR